MNVFAVYCERHWDVKIPGNAWDSQIHGLSLLSTQCEVVASKASVWSQLANEFDYFVHPCYCGPLFVLQNVLIELKWSCSLLCSIHYSQQQHKLWGQCFAASVYFICVFDWQHAIHADVYLHKSTHSGPPLLLSAGLFSFPYWLS